MDKNQWFQKHNYSEKSNVNENSSHGYKFEKKEISSIFNDIVHS